MCPALVAEAFAGSRIVAFSTGNVYPYADVTKGGATESTPAVPPSGAYANSCVAREGMFAYFSRLYGTPGRLIRLNYAIDMRYGVLHDVATKVFGELLRIWRESRKTIVFVTHGITEAVFLGTQVVVLTAGPARMADNFAVDLPHPRTLDMKTHEKFGEYTRRVYRLLGLE